MRGAVSRQIAKGTKKEAWDFVLFVACRAKAKAW
jgi:hypothetical protein